MIRKRRWLWVLLFIWMAFLLVLLATSWNLVLVRDYRQIMTLARQVSTRVETTKPWESLIFGTLGFVAAMGTILLFFLKILKEMKLNQTQSEFLAAVSHELKTPIASMALSASLIRSGGLSDQEVSRLWTTHDTELTRLKEEVDTLLESARMQAEPFREKQSSIVLESWLSHSFERWQRILGPDSKLTREGESLPLHARMDLRTLNLITDNLVDNARKFSQGKPELIVTTRKISARFPWVRARWHIEFRDQGLGFDPADSRKIFNRFFRARTEAPYSIPGNGLGLHLAESASKALGLTLRGESPGKGHGACFTLEGKEARR
jgi:two-component system phosphate regulon sensor histidine kinase PhoR